MQARPYQQHCIDAIERGFDEGFTKQLAVLPTGSGKTLIFSWCAQRRLPERTLILAHREELIDQAIAKLHAATGIVAGKEKAESSVPVGHHSVVVASFQTMARRLDKWPRDHFSLVVADEGHHAIAPSQQVVLNHFDQHADVLGVTATPDRGDKKDLGKYFENIAAEVPLYTRADNPIPGLIDSGFLSPIAVRSIPLRINLNEVQSVAGDFASVGLGEALEPYLDQIAAAIRAHAGFRRTLAFLPLIATSRKFVAACRNCGLSAEHIDGEATDRKDILDRFAAGEFDLLSNAMLLTEGYDVDSAPTGIGIDCVVVLRPTRSRPLYAQMVGRGTRIAPLKDDLLLLDFLWLHDKHKIARPAHLIAQTEEEAEAITQLTEQANAMPGDVAEQLPLDLQALDGRATKQREENLRKRLEEQRHKKGKFISAEEFALSHDSLATAEYEPTMRWESDAVTDKQLRYLKQAHIDPATVRGKGHANRLLTLFFATKKLTLASPKQQAKMRQMGHPNPEQATEGEARKFFASLRSQGAVRFADGGGVMI